MLENFEIQHPEPLTEPLPDLEKPTLKSPESAGPESGQMENFSSPEGRALEPEVRHDVPNCEEAWVTGGPFDAADRMDIKQGDNPYHAAGNCGLVSICNTLRRAGMDVTENDVTKTAIDNGLCHYDPNGPPGENGGTNLEMRRQVLALFGIDSEICRPGCGGSLEDIAGAIDSGRGVVISVSADLLWDEDMGGVGLFGPQSNHCVAVTGIARDAATGEIAGVYIADSGRGLEGDACRYLTVGEFDEVYTNVWGTGANITTGPLMGG